MPNLVIYYSWSKYGNTEKAALYLAEKLGADQEKLKDKNEKKGIIGWLYNGKRATQKMLTQIEPLKSNLDSYDTIYIGGPVWSWNISPVIRTLVNDYKFIGKKIVLFCTMGSTGDQQSFKTIKEIMGLGVNFIGEFALNTKEMKSEEYKEKIDKFLENIK